MSLQILDYSDKDLFLLGDLHGEFRKLLYLIKERNTPPPARKYLSGPKMTNPNSVYPENCVMIVCGDCGMGFNKTEYYAIELQRLQRELEKKNIILLMLRGNHDDPEYFETVEGKFNFPNIKFIPDYTVLKTKGNVSLCIGGAISYDRSWRLKENERLNKYRKTSKKSVYWKNEGVKQNNELIDELNSNGVKINSIISHTIPFDFLDENYCFLTTDNEWFKADPNVKKDIDRESAILKKLLNKLTENGHEVKWWTFGHTHRGNIKWHTQDDKQIALVNLGIVESLKVIQMDLHRGLGLGIALASEINTAIKMFAESASELSLKSKYARPLTFGMSEPIFANISHEVMEELIEAAINRGYNQDNE